MFLNFSEHECDFVEIMKNNLLLKVLLIPITSFILYQQKEDTCSWDSVSFSNIHEAIRLER